MDTVILIGVLAVVALVVVLYLRAMSSMRHSMDHVQSPPEDMRRVGDQPPREVDNTWMNLNQF